MESPSTARNGSGQHWAVVRPEPPDCFTAELIGLPEVYATATTAEEALRQLRLLFGAWVAAGKLVPLGLSDAVSGSHLPGGTDPYDPLEQEFLADLERAHQEDLDRTLREHEQEDQRCSDTSSTPTT